MKEGEPVPDSVVAAGALPPLRYHDLPPPIPLRRMIGPSVIILGAALGSGEFILWPSIVAHHGFVLWWACMIGLFTQFWVNMEITRYTLATGESTVIGFVRLWKGWAWVFLVCNTVPWVWPGWASAGGNCLTFLVGGGDAAATLYAVVSLILVGIVLSLGPVLYQTMERLQAVMVVLVLVFVAVLAAVVVETESVAAMARGSVRVGFIPEDIALPLLLGAIAYAGAGGSLNLSQSNYIRDKSYGMGAFIGRITSLVTGREEAIPDTGYLPPETEENRARWRRWWRAANWEHFLIFFVLGALSLIALACIVHSTLAGAEVGKGMDFIRQEGLRLGELLGRFAKIGFWTAGFLILFTTELGIMDMVARVSADIVRTHWARGSEFWSLRRLYYVFLWAEILVGCRILTAGFNQPLELLVLGASLNGLVMAFYSLLLLWMNSRVLPRWLGVGVVRFLALVWACAFYGYFATITLADRIPKLFR